MLRLLLLSALLVPAVSAQADVTGRVLDGEYPLPTASVALWQISGADSTLVGGATTNLEGVFHIDDVSAGSYQLVASFVGYDAATLEVELGASDLEVGTITLAPTAEALTEVQVTAERPQRQVRIDRTVYDTADDPVAAGGNATDVLSTIPSVDVDIDGNVSLRGAGSVAVFVNGRPAPVSADFVAGYLASLPAGSIERVEVIPNPSAAFEPDGVGGVINIVLKANTDLGWGGTVTAGTDSEGGLNATGAVTYGRGPWSLAATYGLRSDQRGGSGSTFSVNRFEADPSTLDQVEVQGRNNLSNFVSLSADYALSPQTTLTSQLQLGTQDGDDEETNATLRLNAAGTPLAEYERFATEQESGYSGGVRLGLRQQFGENHRLTAEVSGEAEEEGEAQAFDDRVFFGTATFGLPPQTDEDDAEREAELRIDYTRPVWGFQVDLGYNGSIETETSTLDARRFGVDGTLALDPNLSNTSDFEERIQAVYVQAARDWGLFGVQAGVRAEQATTTLGLVTTGEEFGNDYQSLFPSAFLSFKPTPATTLRGGYSRRIDRPRRWELNPFPSFDVTGAIIRQGNPALRPEYTDSFEISAEQITSFGSVGVTPYYRRTTDIVRRIATLRDDGVTVRAPQNLDTADAWGAEAVLSLDGVGGLEGFVSLEGYRLQTDGTAGDAELSSDAFGWGGRVNASYGFGDRFGWGDLDLQTTVRYSAPIDTEQGRRGARTSIDLALRQRIGDRASLTLQVRDPLDLAELEFVFDQPELYQEIVRDWRVRQFGLAFSYQFGRQERNRDRDRQGGGDFGGEEF
ncbi:TonB-dependent receptor domain-containing protein [Rubrivirga sp.]|uniref:TonB-dependent receptor domain-containing protein n=1 Tax=Rubrivirga sp. TaxID=1885344 RepID=UPI003C75C37A